MGARIVTIIGATLLVALCYLLTGVVSQSALLVAGLVFGLLPYGLWRLRESESSPMWELYAPAYVAAAGIISGAAARRLMPIGEEETLDPVYDFAALLIGLAAGGAVILLKRRKVVEKCHRCQKPLGKDRVHCPRSGGHWVCARCWIEEKFRCKYCDEFKSPLLAMESEEWWTERMGDALRAGNCHLCRRSAAERDLRKCGYCTGAMCIRCWDMENGRCAKCRRWVMPDLPEPLARFNAQFDDDF